MKTRIAFIYLMLSVILLAAAGKAALAEDPPQIDKNWNLISVTCDVDLDQFRQRLGNDAIEVFAWDGEKYTAVDRLLRGYGYSINSNAVLNSSKICGGQTEAWTTTVSIHQGWNLIGNPYHQPVVIADLLGEQADHFDDLMFEYQGNKYREITKSDKIKVWRAIWVYSDSDLELVYQIECGELSIELASPESPELVVGDPAAFQALCSVEEGGETDGQDCGLSKETGGGEEVQDCGDDWSGYVDVTAEVLWHLSNPNVFAPGETPGAYTAAAPGTCGVNAEYGDKDSNTITVNVTGPEPVLVSISLSAEKTALEKGETTALTVTGHYSDGTQANLTDAAEYSLGSEGIGYLEGSSFTGMSPGIVEITATVGELTDSLSITVQEPGRKITSLELYGYPRSIEIYETAVFYVYAHYSDGDMERVTQEVEWIYDGAMGRIEKNGMFYPAALGTIEVKAAKDGIESNTVRISVEEKQLIWIGIFPEPNGELKPLPCPDYYGYLFCYNNNYINNGRTGKYYAIADFSNETRQIVTDSIEKWETTDDTILSVAPGGAVTAHRTGTVGVRAYKEGVYSEWSWVQVVDSSTQEFLLLEYSNRETILQPGETAKMNATYYRRSEGVVEPYTVLHNTVDDGIFTARRVTAESTWTVTAPAVGSFDAAQAVYTGAAPGKTDVFAQYNGLTSNSVEIEVWRPEEFQFCDGAAPEASWTDNKTIARLAVDCNTYSPGDQVNVAFDALLSDEESRRVLDVCLDLYIYNSNQELVKVMRNENCSPTPLFRTIEGYTPVFNYTRTWDQKDDNGTAVPPGDYMAVARFYILYCPVLKVPFTISGD